MSLLKNLLANQDREYEPSNDRVCSIVNGKVVEGLHYLDVQSGYKTDDGHLAIMHDADISEDDAIALALAYYKLPQRERATS